MRAQRGQHHGRDQLLQRRRPSACNPAYRPRATTPTAPMCAARIPRKSIPLSGRRPSPTPSVPKRTGAPEAGKSSRFTAAISRSPAPRPASSRALSYADTQNSSHLQHPLRQYRSDAAGGLLEAARSRSCDPLCQEDRPFRRRPRRRRSFPGASASPSGPASGHAGRGPPGQLPCRRAPEPRRLSGAGPSGCTCPPRGPMPRLRPDLPAARAPACRESGAPPPTMPRPPAGPRLRRRTSRRRPGMPPGSPTIAPPQQPMGPQTVPQPAPMPPGMPSQQDIDTAAAVMEKALEIVVDDEASHEAVKAAVRDMLLPGRGICRVRWKPILKQIPVEDPVMGGPLTNPVTGEPQMKDAKIWETVDDEYVFWEDILLDPVRQHGDVEWIAFRHLFAEKALTSRVRRERKTSGIHQGQQALGATEMDRRKRGEVPRRRRPGPEDRGQARHASCARRWSGKSGTARRAK